MRAPWSRRTAPQVDPGRHHAFAETNDSGIGAVASGGSLQWGNPVKSLAVTTAMLRGTRCAVPGCERTREDPIHFPED